MRGHVFNTIGPERTLAVRTSSLRQRTVIVCVKTRAVARPRVGGSGQNLFAAFYRQPSRKGLLILQK